MFVLRKKKEQACQSMQLSHVIASALFVSRLRDTPAFLPCLATIGGVCFLREHMLDVITLDALQNISMLE